MPFTPREELKSLAYARNRWIPKNDDGKPINASTVVRWTRQGLLTPDGKRIRLEVQYRGNVPMTSREAVTRFIEAVTFARLQPAIIHSAAASEVAAVRSSDMRT
jgi:hypothetical protein